MSYLAYCTKINGIADTVEVAIIDNRTDSIVGDVIGYVPVTTLPCLVALVTGYRADYVGFQGAVMALVTHYDAMVR